MNHCDACAKAIKHPRRVLCGSGKFKRGYAACSEKCEERIRKLDSGAVEPKLTVCTYSGARPLRGMGNGVAYG